MTWQEVYRGTFPGAAYLESVGGPGQGKKLSKEAALILEELCSWDSQGLGLSPPGSVAGYGLSPEDHSQGRATQQGPVSRGTRLLTLPAAGGMRA